MICILFGSIKSFARIDMSGVIVFDHPFTNIKINLVESRSVRVCAISVLRNDKLIFPVLHYRAYGAAST